MSIVLQDIQRTAPLQTPLHTGSSKTDSARSSSIRTKAVEKPVESVDARFGCWQPAILGTGGGSRGS